MNKPTEQPVAMCPLCGYHFPGFSLGNQRRDQAILASICPMLHSRDELRRSFREVFAA